MVRNLTLLSLEASDAILGGSAGQESIGVDLTDRTVLEAEVLIWRILRQKSAMLTRHSLYKGESDLFT